MLGRTNITTIKGGPIATDIASYDWNDAATLNVNSSFKKSFYANNILTAITKSGTILYTKDGENWEEAALEMDVKYNISDGIWDGHRFVFVGSHFTDQENVCQALIVITKDYQEYVIMRDCTGKNYAGRNAQYNILDQVYCGRFHAILLNEDSTYTIICSTIAHILDSTNSPVSPVFFVRGDVRNLQFTCDILYNIKYGSVTPERALDNIHVEIAKNTDSFIFYVKAVTAETATAETAGNYYRHIVGISDNGQNFLKLEDYNGKDSTHPVIASNMFKIFECKDSLYYMTLLEEQNRLVQVKGFSDGKGSVISADEDWKFVDAVYFNKCEIYINAHQMLVVKAGENMADKTEKDLIDISYDFSLINIVKAFENLYIFGTNGNILVSSDEIKNENATAVKTMSAVKALYEAKEYTDKKYTELEERVSKLEELKNSSTEV